MEEGRQEGRQDGKCRVIQRQLARRWGKLSPILEQRLVGLSSEQLDLLAEALLDFRSPADLETWLRTAERNPLSASPAANPWDLFNARPSLW